MMTTRDRFARPRRRTQQRNKKQAMMTTKESNTKSSDSRPPSFVWESIGWKTFLWDENNRACFTRNSREWLELISLIIVYFLILSGYAAIFWFVFKSFLEETHIRNHEPGHENGFNVPGIHSLNLMI